jgi:hypothetical protein
MGRAFFREIGTEFREVPFEALIRVDPNERIATHFFPALDGFQQKSPFGSPGNPQKGGNRREQVCQYGFVINHLIAIYCQKIKRPWRNSPRPFSFDLYLAL